MVLEIAAMIVFWGQIDRVLGAAFIFSANMCHVVKLSNFLANRDEFVSLLNYYVDSLTKRNLKDSSVVDIIVAFEKISFRDLLAVMIWTCFAVISLALIGDLMDPSGLPLIAYYPFEIQYFPMFQLVYLHQMVAVMTAATFNVILDILSTNMVIQMCCQFRLLKRDIILIQELDSVKDDGAIAERLREVIVRHSVLKTKCNELSNIFGVPILGQFLGSIFIICIGFFQFYRASDTGTDILTVIATITTILWALLQAFFYCHHGNELKIEVRDGKILLMMISLLIFKFQSESVAEVLAALPWYTFSPKNKRLVLLMIHAGQQPAIIKAAGLVHVTLAALMTVSLY